MLTDGPGKAKCSVNWGHLDENPQDFDHQTICNAERRLLWWKPENSLVIPLVEAIKLKEETFRAWLVQGSSEAAEMYREARRTTTSVK